MLVRPLQPTDLLAFLAFRRLFRVSEALGDPAGAVVAGDRQPAGLAGIGTLTDSALTLAAHREWLALRDGPAICGVAAVRPRFGTDTWDIAHLEIASSVDVSRASQVLLEALCQRAVVEGVEKLYLRLREDSAAVVAARQLGMFAYAQELVCVSAGGAPLALEPGAEVELAGLRPRQPSDHQSLFQLYSSTVPLSVRQVEAMTLREWRWLDGWSARVAWPGRVRHRRDFVVAREGSIVGWLRVCPIRRRLEVSGRSPALGRALIAFGIDRIGREEPVTLVLRSYQQSLLPVADDLGFGLVARNWLLVRVFTIRATDTLLVPIGAS